MTMIANRRRRILVNGDEVRTDGALREAASEIGYRIDAKVRVADTLDIDDSGLSNEAYGYAMKAHFDWVVSDAETTEARFAVEFDGLSHQSVAARRKDELKDGICERLDLPLLRIDGMVLRPYRQRTVLAVLVEAWALYEGFIEAQESGTMPLDEVFDPHMSLDAHIEEGRLVVEQPYNLAATPAALLRRLRRSGQIPAWRRALRSQEGTHHAFAWAYLPDGRVIVGRAAVRSSSFPAFPSYDLADDLSFLDLADRLQRYLEGDASVVETVDRLVERVPMALAQLETHFSVADLDGWGFGSG